jgi:hypothetical protein
MIPPRRPLPTPWTVYGNSGGYADETIADQIIMKNVLDSTQKVSQYGIGHVYGAEGQVFPAPITGTARQATDSIITDTARAESQ